MGTQIKTKIDRRRREIAASYRKQGYRVTIPSAPEALPPFLHDCHPDLIAESDADRVVIEVKASSALRGANDLVELAKRVAGQPGWRLELVTVRAEPDYGQFADPEWLETMLVTPAPGADVAHECIYRNEILAWLLRGVASENGIRVRDKAPLHLARELAFQGVIDQDLLDRIEAAAAWRDRFMHRSPLSPTPEEQVVTFERLCRDIVTQAQHPED